MRLNLSINPTKMGSKVVSCSNLRTNSFYSSTYWSYLWMNWVVTTNIRTANLDLSLNYRAIFPSKGKIVVL